jgi:hypothetical protein
MSEETQPQEAQPQERQRDESAVPEPARADEGESSDANGESSPAADVAATGTALRKGERDCGIDLREGRGTTG